MDFILDFSIFQKRLRDIIESHGKMVQEVADDTGISKITLSRYLNNHREPDLKYVVALAQYFNVSIEWMLGLSDSEFEVLPPETQEFVHLFSLASHDDRRVIEAVLSKYREE